MKLSFSLPSKSKPKVTAAADGSNAVDDGNSREFVTEFDPSKTLADSNPKHVIPPIENTWKPYKKMKNLDLPLQSANTGSGLEFEPEVPLGDSQGSNNITYGLNLRQKVKEGAAASRFGGDATEDREPAPLEQLMMQNLRKDLESLADNPTWEDFESVPVEGYGAALMAGYGWKPGKGIGKNAKEDVEIKEYKRWTAKEGLGFDPDRSKVVDAKAKVKESGKPRDINGGDVFFVGKEVRIIAGRDIGLKGKIVEKPSSEFFVIKLSGSEEEVKVGVNEVADLGSQEEEKCLKKLKDLQLNEKEKDKKASKQGRGKERGSRTEARRVSEKQDRGEATREKRDKASWLRSHIKVRIVCKELKGGRLYLKKGKVVDVVGPTTCDIMMDETQELVQGVDQELLETALPRRGGPVLVLLGKHKGVYGNLVEKDLDKETGVVRDLDNHKMLDVRLEQVAEYMGDMDDVEY